MTILGARNIEEQQCVCVDGKSGHVCLAAGEAKPLDSHLEPPMHVKPEHHNSLHHNSESSAYE